MNLLSEECSNFHIIQTKIFFLIVLNFFLFQRKNIDDLNGSNILYIIQNIYIYCLFLHKTHIKHKISIKKRKYHRQTNK